MAVVWIVAATILVLLMLPYMKRAILGPSVFDRLVALNAMGTQVAVLLVISGLLYKSVEMFVDIALALFLLNFVATLLVARYVNERRRERA
jgi:multicomponent Na+:H+ antiporter subunit F